MNIQADFEDEVITGDPGENGQPENEPYDGLYEMSYSSPIGWNSSTPLEEKETILLNRMSNMPESDKTMFLKVVRYNVIAELIDAIQNLKGTSEETWKNIISKLQNLLNFNDSDTSKFDFNKLLTTLLPLVALLAGLLIGLKKSEIEDSKSSEGSDEIKNDPVYKALQNKNIDDDSEIDIVTGKLKSVVLTKCNKMVEGFKC